MAEANGKGNGNGNRDAIAASSQTVEEVLKNWEVERQRGLDPSTVEGRWQKYGPNRLEEAKKGRRRPTADPLGARPRRTARRPPKSRLKISIPR